MSRMLPQPIVQTLRQYSTIAVQLWGIDCDLFIPESPALDQEEQFDIYDETPAADAIPVEMIQTQVFIEWSPNIHRLRALGLYVEDSVPIVAWFDPKLPVVRKSYFRIDINYIPEDFNDTDEFEVTDNLIRAMHDAVTVKAFSIAPRRKEATLP